MVRNTLSRAECWGIIKPVKQLFKIFDVISKDNGGVC